MLGELTVQTIATRRRPRWFWTLAALSRALAAVVRRLDRWLGVVILAVMTVGCQSFYPGTTLDISSPSGKSIHWQNGKDFGLAAQEAEAETADGTRIRLRGVVIGNNASDVADAWERVDRARFGGVVGIIDASGRFVGTAAPLIIQPQTPPASQPAATFPTFP